jgi:hypothetical protein
MFAGLVRPISMERVFNTLARDFTVGDLFLAVFCFAGAALLSTWLVRTSFAAKALTSPVVRRNRLAAPPPIVLLAGYFFLAQVLRAAFQQAFSRLADWQMVLMENIAATSAAVFIVALAVVVVRRSFARGLKGFGLNPSTTAKDLLAAGVNLIAVWPVIMAAMLLTNWLGQFFVGQDFHMQRHEALKTLVDYPQWQVKLTTAAFAVIIAPVLEEVIFRGLFQSLLRGVFSQPWTAIFITAAIFASVHANMSHWPVLLVLGVCMGYAYEKSGSILRPIFIHSLFNATTIIGVLSVTHGV